MHEFAEYMFTDAVMQAQQRYGSRENYERFTKVAGPNNELTERETRFIAARDTFYMATVNENGWPYVQHRGGPTGFLRVLNSNQLAYADFRGNAQLISAGNVSVNDKVSLILMDYARRKRLKIIGHLSFTDVDDANANLVEGVTHPDYKASIERVATIDIVAFDWNCPQHIQQRYTAAEWAAMTQTGESR